MKLILIAAVLLNSTVQAKTYSQQHIAALVQIDQNACKRNLMRSTDLPTATILRLCKRTK